MRGQLIHQRIQGSKHKKTANGYDCKQRNIDQTHHRQQPVQHRKGKCQMHGLQFHNLRLDSQNYTLSYGQEQIKLSLKEYQIMEIFMSNPKQIVSKEFFIEKRSDAVYTRS